jgi:hypothetical protein
MLKKIIGLLLLSSVAQAVTTTDIPTIITVTQQIQQITFQLAQLSRVAQQLSDANFVFTVQYSTATVPVTAQQKADLINTYTNLKTQLINAVGNLP